MHIIRNRPVSTNRPGQGIKPWQPPAARSQNPVDPAIRTRLEQAGKRQDASEASQASREETPSSKPFEGHLKALQAAWAPESGATAALSGPGSGPAGSKPRPPAPPVNPIQNW